MLCLKCLPLVGLLMMFPFISAKALHQCTEDGKLMSLEAEAEGYFCCRNNVGEWFVGQRPDQLCCPGATGNPIYLLGEKMCNGTEIILWNSDYSQCEPDQLCVRGAVPDPVSNVPVQTESIDPIDDYDENEDLYNQNINDGECTGDKQNCCGGRVLPPTHLCYRNHRVEKEDPSHNKVCGGKTFNNRVSKCRDEEIVPRKDQQIEPPLMSFIRVTRISKGSPKTRRRGCTLIADVVVPNASEAFQLENLSIEIKSGCRRYNKLKKAWYIMLTNGPLHQSRNVLRVNNPKQLDFTKLPRKSKRYVDKYWRKNRIILT